MFDIAPTEFLIVALVALVVIGPKDLPRVMRTVGNWTAKARGMARHFRSGLDTMMREAELEEMEKKWKAENERIMRDHPPASLPSPMPGQSAVDSPQADAPPPEDEMPRPRAGDDDRALP